MGIQTQWNDKVFSVTNAGFEALAIDVFQFQYQHNPLYQQYVLALGVEPQKVDTPARIPFLPIRFFKSHKVVTTSFEPALVFESSGTTGSINSKHFLKDADLYTHSFRSAFQRFYGAPGDYAILGLLPSYLERKNASLVYMVNELIKESANADSGFYLSEHDQLLNIIRKREADQQQTLLIGVTFALLDLAEMLMKAGQPMQLKYTTVMETGGMKGRRRELIRAEAHEILKTAFGVETIHSEYGMTELLSQAYSKGNGLFHCPSWMKIMLRDEEDPLSMRIPANGSSSTGAINVIDLANIFSCSFIATDDAGRSYSNGDFEVLGRMDNSDLRGCGLMVL